MMRSRSLTDEDIAIAKALMADGWIQSDVASLLGCNGGRIAEINTGQRGAEVTAADLTAPETVAHIARLHIDWTLRIGRQLKVFVS